MDCGSALNQDDTFVEGRCRMRISLDKAAELSIAVKSFPANHLADDTILQELQRRIEMIFHTGR
jgi:hypothetical protein